MTFFCHGKPENFQISVENGKLIVKMQKAVLKSFGKQPKDNEKWRKPGKQGKKPRKAGKTWNFPQKAGNGPPITPP